MAGFRAGRSTTEQIFNLRILCAKYLQHQQDLYHIFINFKKAFHRVWHEALKKHNISTNLIQVIKNLYNKATSAVLFNSSIGDWFRTRRKLFLCEFLDMWAFVEMRLWIELLKKLLKRNSQKT